MITSDTLELEFINNIDDELTAGISTWNMFPNPASGLVHFEIEFNTPIESKVSIIGIDGKSIIEHEIKNSIRMGTSIDVSALATGIYFVQFETSKGVASRKLIVR